MKNFHKRCFLLLLSLLLSGGCATTHTVKIPKEAEVTRKLGEAYLSERKYVAALRELLKAEAMAPKDPVVHNDLGLVYLARDRQGLAVGHFEKALNLKPDYARARNNLGTAHIAGKDWDAAIACFKPLTENLLYENPHYPLSNLGLAYYYKGDYAQAERYYRQALAEKPGFNVALRGLGRTYIESGKPELAVKVISESLASHGGTAAIYLELGNAFMALREYGKAKEAYRTVREMNPDGPLGAHAKKMLARMGG